MTSFICSLSTVPSVDSSDFKFFCFSNFPFVESQSDLCTHWCFVLQRFCRVDQGYLLFAKNKMDVRKILAKVFSVNQVFDLKRKLDI